MDNLDDIISQHRLDGQSALVVGGGHGMGRASTLGLADLGAAVSVADIDEKSAADVRDEILHRNGSAQSFAVDLGSVKSVRELFAHFDKSPQGSLDILVIVAAVVQRKKIVDFEEADWDYVANVNTKGTFFCLQEGARRMIPKKRGKIVLFGSLSGFIASEISCAYAVSKGAIRQMTVSAAIELAGDGINVNSIAPSAIRTDFNQSVHDTPEKLAAASARLPLKRMGVPDDIVGAVVFLCSPVSDYVTGHTLMVDGGRLARG